MGLLFALLTLSVPGSWAATTPEALVARKLEALHAPQPVKINSPFALRALNASDLALERLKLDGHTIWVRARCTQLRVCRPFYVELLYPDTQTAVTAYAQLNHAQSIQRVAGRIVLRAGSFTGLSLRHKSATLRMRAKALKNARVGESVRVRTSDNRIYTAIVRSKDLVEAAW